MRRIIVLIAILWQVSIAYCQTNPKEFPVLKVPYLGQKPPGLTLEIFAPEIVSTGLDEGVITFTPDGKECYWSILFPRFETILVSKQVNGKWTKPEVATFSGKYYDGWPAIQPDGKKMFFHGLSLKLNGHKNVFIWFNFTLDGK